MRHASRARIATLFTLSVLGLAGTAYATHLMVDTDGHTTLEQVLTESNDPNYKTLSVQQVNDDYIVRAPAGAPAQNGRETRRTSLAYFAQLTDSQLADEESPARVEFADAAASSAWRPQEALLPFVLDASIKQVNRFVPSSVVPQGNGLGNSMDFALMTGDQTDNNQRNELRWTRELIEGGGPLTFNSGVTDPAFYSSPAFLSKPSCLLYLASEGGSAAAAAAEAAGYTGVQDYDDYPAPPGPAPAYYDPDQPLGQYADWPQYAGLMDRAQTATLTPEGLDVPSYWSNGNHDILVQGNEDANVAFEEIATACFKALGTTLSIPPSLGPDFAPDPNLLLSPLNVGMLVPPDPERRFLDRPQIKQVLGENGEDDSHGFDFVDPAEEAASNGNASYYAWDPPQTPGFRFINVDTNSEGGQTAEGVASGSSNGNIDDPQFQWLREELDAAQAADKLIVIFGHHPVRSMSTEIVDEQALPCTVNDSHGDTPEHDINPGCDRDPRISAPIHLGADPFPGDPRESFVELLEDYPNVITYVAGHTHEHRLIPFTRPDQSVWWEINTSATVDWPQQHRLIEIMDNRDDTLSIFGTVLDAAAPSEQPAEGSAAAFDSGQLASIGRTLSFNDPDNNQSGEGTPNDRNVEMLVDDPREADVSVTKSDDPDPVVAGGSLTYTMEVTNNDPTTTATLVNLADLLPPTATFTGSTTTQGTCTPPAAGTLNCALGDLAPGQIVTVTVTVSPQTAGTITNQATVSSVTDDPVPGNNTDVEQTTVNPTPGVSADLSITKEASAASLTLGEQLTYTLTVTNNGPDTADGVATTDELPNGAGFVSADATQGTCSNAGAVVTCLIGSMANGDTETVTIVTTTQLVRTLVNEASVASGAADPAPANNSASATTVVNAPPAGPGPGGDPGAPTAAKGRCRGKEATITGTTGPDKIRGTRGRDVIAAGPGRDIVKGLGGNDLICGGAGHDRLFGGPGRDVILGGPGNDRLFGGPGKDILFGGNGRDILSGGKGRDRLRGGKGRDRCPKGERPCGVK